MKKPENWSFKGDSLPHETKAENEYPSIIHVYRAKGWLFVYHETTKQIFAEHPNRKTRRICLITDMLQPEEWGEAIAEILNGRMPV